MATSNTENLKYVNDVESLHFPDSEGSACWDLQDCNSEKGELPESDLQSLEDGEGEVSVNELALVCHDSMEDSVCRSSGEECDSEIGSNFSDLSSDTEDGDPRRGAIVSSSGAAEGLNDNDLDEDYRLAMELDREMNGDLADLGRLDQLLWNIDEEFRTEEEVPESLYPLGEALTTECQICFQEKFLHQRVCCQYPVCDECLIMYFEVQVSQANVQIACPHCQSFVYRAEVFDRLSEELKTKFYKFIVDANKDPFKKTCPRCSAIQSIENWQLKDKKVKKYGLQVECADCNFEWCFQCQAPLHPEMKCKDYIKGEKMVKEWANQIQGEQANARRCPKCKIWIQRSTGCDHMTCNQCNAQFCYRCGGRYMSLRYIGGHHNRWSILGCRKNFLPENPVARRLVRGSVFAGQIVGGLALGGVALAVAGAVAGVAVVALPIYGSVRLHHKIKQRKRVWKQRQEFKEAQERYQRRIMDIKSRGDPYLEQWHRNQRVRLQQQARSQSSPPRNLEIPLPHSTSDVTDDSSVEGFDTRVASNTARDIMGHASLDRDSMDFGFDTICDSDNEDDMGWSRSIHTSMAEIHSTADLDTTVTSVRENSSVPAAAETISKVSAKDGEKSEVKVNTCLCLSTGL